ncbi:hybrid sensor histidine kinase/response regulator [Zestomonas carbonaria]|uniref:histidine kinase n=1 Tax=Zestomonas carbonaria TaxID=2762745 RepID=A0A7U7EMU6_9GAMM|nr:hybrid sensor histidine kinase/response regulator [Pseudomonas carbonaria]CAD5107939.1 Sensor histidine kinase RcsC [Pseudomonas carbonaria]
MAPDNGSIHKLASTSLRLNIVLLCALPLAVLLIGITYWALGRVVQEEKDKINFHFSRLIGDILEHEKFLMRETRPGALPSESGAKEQDIVPVRGRLLARIDGLEIHEGREFSFAMPFTLAQRRRHLELGDHPRPFSLGVRLANFYSSYWSISRYPSPQVVLFDMNSSTSLAVPSIGNFPGHNALTRETYQAVMERIRDGVQQSRRPEEDTSVQWGVARRYSGDDANLELLGFTTLDVPDSLWWVGDQTRHVVAVSLLDLERIDDFEQILARAVFDEMALISPRGDVLVDSQAMPQDYDEGMTFTANGLLFKLSSAPQNGWVALYRVDYRSLFRTAKWPLLGILALLLGSLGGGWYMVRWYARRVVEPANRAHRYIVESDAFSRDVIQTAPVALCVMRRSDHQVVMQNRLAELWLGDAQNITRMSRDWDFSTAPGEAGGEVCAVVNGRYLCASFAPTRYNGEDVELCAFNDITAHKEAQLALAEAKRSADAASEAKTLFLATMSHEIRTPLYGVLGTLELLGLTELTQQQEEYLRTIQRSSSTLLQLISDVLDVSKIEAGQMALEEVEFSPLELAEEVMRGYAAVAEGKHLQFYACVDAEVPGLVRGDAARIRQILNNLLSNALKFTDIGRVVLRLKPIEFGDGWVELQWQVTDTGIGISEEQQERLFEPFYQVHGHQHTISGTGLGLSICWSLTRMMDGSLRVISEVGLGSSFTLRLPLEVVDTRQRAAEGIQLLRESVYVRAPLKELAACLCAWVERWGATAIAVALLPNSPPEGSVLLDLLPDGLPESTWAGPRVSALLDGGYLPQRVGQDWQVNIHHLRGIGQALRLAQRGEAVMEMADEPAPRLEKLGLRILVAEDNPINQVLLKEQLEELGCSVVLAANGREALRHWGAGDFDLLLTDVNMPEMNGYELVKALRQQGVDIPIIGVTANATREEGERCMAVGMNAWLVKPMSLCTLHGGLRRVCGGMPPAVSPPSASVAADEAVDRIQVSEKMRGLFLKTMRQDTQSLREALLRGDLGDVRQMLHRLRGALAVVQAHGLAEACGSVEEDLLAESPGPDLSAKVAALMERIGAALEDI